MEEERKGTKLLGWLFVRLGIWGVGCVAGWIISALLPQPIAGVHIAAVGPAKVSWGFITTLFGCLALGLLLWRDPSWSNKVAWALSFAIAIGVIAPEEGRMITILISFLVPIAIMVIKAFFGREAPARPAEATQAGPGIGFQAGIGLGGTEQIDLAGILRDRERAAADSAAAQLLNWCGQAMQSGGSLGALANVLAETVLAEQLARRGYRIVEEPESEAEQGPTQVPAAIRRGRATNPLARLLRRR